MKTTIICLLLCLCFYSNLLSQNFYHYYKGVKHFLTVDSAKHFITAYPGTDPVAWKSALTNYGVSIEKSGEMNGSGISWAIVKNPLARSISSQIVSYESPYFVNEVGASTGLSQFFYVKLKSSADLQVLRSIAAEHKVKIEEQNKFMPLWYTLSCSRQSAGNALQMANLFFETNLFSAAEPDLMGDGHDINCASDPYFTATGTNGQWNLKDKLNICPAWQVTTSCDETVVAVIDSGIDKTHPDLSANIHSLSYDTESGTYSSQILGPTPSTQAHGTNCAGVISAKSNSIGVAGVAPNGKLMAISNSMADQPNSRQKRADGINFAWQNGADIISNSWSWAGTGYQIIDDAIYNAVTYGRNGLGCVVVFSVGTTSTGGTYLLNYPANNPLVIAVGAVDEVDDKSNSNYGDDLDVVAPGRNIWTTDIQGAGGGSPDDYTLFSGSSAAAPHVAGLAALILSIKPFLTQGQVRNLIEANTDKILGSSSPTYSYSYNKPNGIWNYYVGYGRINAQKTVAATAAGLGTYSVMGVNTLCTSGSQYSLDNTPPSWTSVVWTAGNGVSINASNGFANAVSNYQGTSSISATIYGACPLYVATKNIWAGIPFVSVSTSSWTSGNYLYHSATATQLPNTSYSDYVWYDELPNGVTGSVLATGFTLSNLQVSPCSIKYYQLQVQTPCGISVYRGYAYNSMGCGGGYYMISASPNPVETKLALNQTHVSESSSMTDEEAMAFIRDSSNGRKDKGRYDSFAVIDKFGTILLRGPIHEHATEIDFSRLEAGLYYLQLNGSNEAEVIRLVKK